MGKSTKQTRSTLAILLLIISIASVITLTPFIILRIIASHYYIAAASLVAVFCMLSIFVYVYRTNKTKIASIVLVSFSLGGGLISFYISNYNVIYWIYPSMLATFFVMRPVYGLLINFSVFALYFPRCLGVHDSFEIIIVTISVLLTNIIAYSFAEGQRQQSAMLKRVASEDYLTKTGNRRALDRKLKKVHKLLQNHDNTASIVLLDLDHFKQINDIHGHLVGDDILVDLSSILKNQTSKDNIYRYGGEEFIIIYTNIDLPTAYIYAEKLRIIIRNNIAVADKPVTISLGVAEYHKDESIEDWIHRVDLSLYQAKSQGRDRTIKAD